LQLLYNKEIADPSAGAEGAIASHPMLRQEQCIRELYEHDSADEQSCTDVLAGFDGTRVVVVFVYNHRRVFTCVSNEIGALARGESVVFSVPHEITSKVHPHHHNPAKFTETYINVGHTTAVKVKDGAEELDRFMLLFPMSIGGNDHHDRGPFIAVRRIISQTGAQAGGSTKGSAGGGVGGDEDGDEDDGHASILGLWSLQALDLLHMAHSVIEPAIAPLTDPNEANCELVMNCRDTRKTEATTIPMTKRWRVEVTIAVGSSDCGSAANWPNSTSPGSPQKSSYWATKSNGGYEVTNLADPLLTEGGTTGMLRLSRTGQVIYAGFTDRYFRKGLALYERGSSATRYKLLLPITDKTVMTPSLVELGIQSDGSEGGTWIGLLYERGGHPREYPLAGVVFQATEVVFERVFIADRVGGR
jgi:hypothetical protein